jgi:putative ABC transport system permease protein
MHLRDLLHETFTAITANKVRSFLTILGIVIGIASVISMVAIGEGAQKSIQDSIQSIGSNLIMISPGQSRSIGSQVTNSRGSAQTLTLKDSEAISKEIKQIKAVAPQVDSRYQVTAKGTNTNTQIVGTTSSYIIVRNLEIAQGSFITESHVKSLSKVAVLGPTTRDDLFGENVNPINQKIRINNIVFKVIGVTKAKGGSGFGSQDDMIFLPISTAQKFLKGDDYVSSINVAAENQDSMSQVQDDITTLLLKKHKISNSNEADFSIMNQADIVSSASSITGTFTILLGAIASISLIVGGIGIMNMMLTSVTERIKEIGLRKAIGAKKHDITMQFLIEAVMLTFLGGLIGIIFGWGISIIVGKIFSISTVITLKSILLAFGVSAGIGIAFGYYPARRAANLNPIEALRYE